MAHNLAIDDESGFAYAVGSDTCRGGLHIISLATPASPSFVGCYDAAGYTHDTQCVVYDGPDTTYTGKQLCFMMQVGTECVGASCPDTGTVLILDVTDKDAIVEISRHEYTASAYAHQGWLGEDQATLYFGDEGDEIVEGNSAHTCTFVLDVSNVAQPVQRQTFCAETRDIDHNMFTSRGHLWQANYCAGLRVMSLTAGLLQTVALFDVAPHCEGLEYIGAWSIYPFFPSGVVALSSVDRGLFLFRPSFLAPGEAWPYAPAAAPPEGTECTSLDVRVTTAWSSLDQQRRPGQYCTGAIQTVQPGLWWGVGPQVYGQAHVYMPDRASDDLECIVHDVPVCLSPGEHFLSVGDRGGMGDHGTLKVEVSMPGSPASVIARFDEDMLPNCLVDPADATPPQGYAPACSFHRAFTVPVAAAPPPSPPPSLWAWLICGLLTQICPPAERPHWICALLARLFVTTCVPE